MRRFNLLVLLAALLPATAGAVESERRWALDLHFGGYHPSIDDELGDARPFGRTFGGSDRLVSQLALERLLFKKLGSAGVGGAIGYSEFYGHGYFADSDDTERADDSTAFKVVPIYAFAAYRFDWMARNWDLPLVPYGKVGLGYWVWWTTNGLGDTSGGGDGSGAKLGGMLAGGLSLHLDPFDPRLAREFDADHGVNDSFIFVEYAAWSADGFGGAGFDLSDEVLSFGLGLEM